MKNRLLATLITVLIFGLSVIAQNTTNETISVPLSSPGKAGKLVVEMHDGKVSVEGHSGSNVEVVITSSEVKTKTKSKHGLKRIPNQALDVSISEEDNVVHVSGAHSKRTDFVIKVPKNFSLSIQTHHNGEINVKDVIGEIEANGHHGGITLTNVGGSVVADTHHGEILVTLQSITRDKPMAFSTYHGDVDVTFPASLGADVKIKTTKGDIYTDFEMPLQKPKLERSKNEGRNEIKLSGWTQGKIGSGGMGLMFTTYHGDVILRKG